MNRDLTRLLIAVDQSDSPPASEVLEAYDGLCQETQAALGRWNELRTQDLPKTNGLLRQQGVAALTAPTQALVAPDCRK